MNDLLSSAQKTPTSPTILAYLGFSSSALAGHGKPAASRFRSASRIIAFVPTIVAIVGMIQASIAANRGEFYRYPMTFRFV